MSKAVQKRITIQSGLYKWFTYTLMAIMCFIGILFLFTTLFQWLPFEEPQDRKYALILFFVWNGLVFYGCYRELLKPTKIVVNSDSSFVLCGPLKTTSYLPVEVQRLECDSDGDCYIFCKNKKIDLRFFKPSQLEIFFKRLRAVNSRLVNDA